MSSWTFSKIQNKIFLKLDLFKQVNKKSFKNKVYFAILEKTFKNWVSITDFNHLVLRAKY